MQIHVFIGLDLKDRHLYAQQSFDRVELTLEDIRSSVAIQVFQEVFMIFEFLKEWFYVCVTQGAYALSCVVTKTIKRRAYLSRNWCYQLIPQGSLDLRL